MIALNLEVVDRDRCFQQFVLHLLDNDIFAIDQNKDVSSAEMNG